MRPGPWWNCGVGSPKPRGVPSAAPSAAETAPVTGVQIVDGHPCALGLGCLWVIRF